MKNKNSFLIFLALLILFSAISFFRLDTDFGWHLRSGEYITTHGIPHNDIFTYTAKNFVWINHEWLNDVIISTIYGFGGYALLAVFFGLLWSGTILLASRSSSWFLIFLATLAVLPYAGIRPVIWSLFFFVLLERILEKKNKYRAFILPIFFLIWANLHGGFVLGLAILGSYILVSKTKISLPVVIATFFATLINPYGLNLYREIGRTLFDTKLHVRILEWLPLFFGSYGIFYIALFSALFLTVYKNKNRLHRIASLPGALLILSVASTRYLPFFIVSSLRYLEMWFRKFKRSIPPLLTGTRRFTWYLLIFLGTSVILYGIIYSLYSLQRDPEASYPKKAVAYLRLHPCKGNIFNAYDFGGYLIWRLPEQPVYIDGRMPSWKNFGQSYLENYYKILEDQAFRKREFKTYKIACAILYTKQKKNWIINYFFPLSRYDEANLSETLKKEGWRAIVEENYSVLLITDR